MRGPGSIPTGDNILSLDFFSRSKASGDIGIIANFMYLWKNSIVGLTTVKESTCLYNLAALIYTAVHVNNSLFEIINFLLGIIDFEVVKIDDNGSWRSVD